jgi:hypothetical protein
MDTGRCGSGGRCWTVRSRTRSGRGGSGGPRRHRSSRRSPQLRPRRPPVAARGGSPSTAHGPPRLQGPQQKPGATTVKEGRHMPGKIVCNGRAPFLGQDPQGKMHPLQSQRPPQVLSPPLRHLRWLMGRHPRQRKQRSRHPGSREVGLGCPRNHDFSQHMPCHAEGASTTVLST